SIDAQLPKLDVAGSIPVSRSLFNNLTRWAARHHPRIAVIAVMSVPASASLLIGMSKRRPAQNAGIHVFHYSLMRFAQAVPHAGSSIGRTSLGRGYRMV